MLMIYLYLYTNKVYLCCSMTTDVCCSLLPVAEFSFYFYLSDRKYIMPIRTVTSEFLVIKYWITWVVCCLGHRIECYCVTITAARL